MIKKILFKNINHKNINFRKFFDKKKSIEANLIYFNKRLKKMDIIFLSYAKDGHMFEEAELTFRRLEGLGRLRKLRRLHSKTEYPYSSLACIVLELA